MTNVAEATPVSGEVKPPARTSFRSLLAQTEIDLRLFGMLVALAAILAWQVVTRSLAARFRIARGPGRSSRTISRRCTRWRASTARRW